MTTEQFRGNGAFSVNEGYATSLRYAVHTTDDGEPERIDLRFMNGRSEIATAQLTAQEAREVLGERNYEAVLQGHRAYATAIKARDEAGPGRSERVPERELRGRKLEFRQVMLPGYAPLAEENAIHLASRARSADKAASQSNDDERLRARNDVPRTAEGAQRAAAGLEERDVRVDMEEQAHLRQLRAHAVPDAVAERFTKVDDKYFFPDRQLAFVDRGTKLKAETNNLEVVRSIVTIAQAREWEALSVTGTKDFRREVWREASLRSIDVRGYEPDDLERQELQRALQKRYGPNEIQREGRQLAPEEQRASARDAIAPAPGGARTKQPRTNLMTGVLLESGAAPYKFKANEKRSFYVKVKTDAGERTVWGVDLERALAQSRTGVKRGDRVTIENQGAWPVTVTTPVHDASGQVVGEKQVKTHRNAWVVEKPAYFDARAEKAAAFRNGDRAKQELVAQYPDLTNAIATMRLGELFAEKLIDRPEDRRRLVASLRESLADAIERGETIQSPKIKEATVRKLDRITGEVDEVAQRAATEKVMKGAREMGARAKAREDMQHARA